MYFENEHTFVAKKSIADSNHTVTEIRLVRMNDEGVELASHTLFSGEQCYQVVTTSPIQRHPSGRLEFFYAMLLNGRATFHWVEIEEDLTPSHHEFQYETYDYYDDNDPTFYPYNTGFVIDKKGNVIISFPPHSQNLHGHTKAIQLLIFNDKGQLVAERLLEDYPWIDRNCILPMPDSLGCRIILHNIEPHPVKYDCHTLDENLNTVSIKNVDALSYPFLCSDEAYFLMNPYNGKTYSNNAFSYPAVNNNPEIVQDILMGVWDRDFNQLGYTWGIHTLTPNSAGHLKSIGFDTEGGVYMVGGMDCTPFFPKNFYIVYMDENLNKYNEIYYHTDYEAIYPDEICLCPNGDLLLSLWIISDSKYYIYKITKETLVSIDEAHSHGFAVATAYPNPGGNTLNIRTALQNASVEVYDMNGRLIHSQALTENVTAIDATDWTEGVYVWKVYTGVSTGSTTLAETGKWIKE